MNTDHSILVATEMISDADMIRKLLRDEFENVATSTNPEQAVEDFEKHRPEVLILAFNNLEKAERYYLGLYRLSSLVHALPHRTLILCNKDNLRRVYELCKKEYFDDYILFWPMPHDATRLLMAVHRALRQMASAATPGGSEIAAQARRLADKNELAPQPEPARALQSLAEHFRPVVLVVEDDEFQHKILEQMLAEMNVDLIFATTGTKALATLRKHRPDLILMDVDLPDIDGVETTRRLKSVEQFANIPVVMITGHSEKAVVVESLKAGASDFVVKPFEKDVLLAKVRSFLSGTQP